MHMLNVSGVWHYISKNSGHKPHHSGQIYVRNVDVSNLWDHVTLSSIPAFKLFTDCLLLLYTSIIRKTFNTDAQKCCLLAQKCFHFNQSKMIFIEAYTRTYCCMLYTSVCSAHCILGFCF